MPKLRAQHKRVTNFVGCAERPSPEGLQPIDTRIDAYEKFRLQRAIKRDPATNCWMWGNNYPDVYGTIMWRGKNVPAHRLMLELARGSAIKPGNHVHHKCGTPACVNPAHLVEVTPQQHREIHSCQPRKRTRVAASVVPG